MSNKTTGSCLCGAVEYEAIVTEQEVHICHCDICKKWHGGPGMAVSCSSDWTVKGEENMTWFQSSEWAQRAFCSKCGTHLLFRMNDGSYHGLSAGSLDSTEDFKVGMHIFIDKKLPYLEFADDSKKLTEKEFLEMVGAT